MVDYAHASYFPRRQQGPPPNISINPHLTPHDPYGPLSAASAYSQHSQRRPTSGVFQAPSYDTYYGSNATYNNYTTQPYYATPMQKQRTSSSSTNTTGGSSSGSTQLRRSGSTNTQASIAPPATSYVAALRRQKATVWCEKAQPEDPRLVATQKAAKLKAAMEVMGSSTNKVRGSGHGLGSGSSSTTSLRGAVRGHHKLGKNGHSSSSAGIGTNSLVTGLPPRLSATEATGDSDEEDDLYMTSHRRSGSGSGRSSLNSNHRSSRVYPSAHRNSSASDIQRRTSNRSNASSGRSINASNIEMVSSKPPAHVLAEPRAAERTFFNHQKLPPPSDPRAALKRSGSVDEGEARTMTMSGLRLVVANPD
ncbi:hypothetical protein FPQ18DRAFT_5298 [Pyronema domesticum]|uniref:Uncharacterized protein n=1 Tax=Pyronema omphalodes (strain CBS 100304) TaxID=1076935 RepID=U4L015_PYROM|nr:hypothetical protein FPQ18DRAFT_5298 [Pyronema domesticum]CCX05319.1 Similar to hypothetical protein [Tuber melanosporum Mel28]; acc. no. XP_002842099 [Pyronema omphalodes CBS 100304]